MAAVLAVGLGATACTSTQTPEEPAEDVVDALAYYENYDTDTAMDQGAPAGGPMRSVDEAADVDIEEPAPPLPPEPGFLDDNTFVDAGDSFWIDTVTALESTFALDVDTGSFSIARTFVAEGWLPEPDSIRVEEWINAFNYGDAAPADGALGLAVESGASPRGGAETALVRVGVSTEELSADERPAANITFVVDTSGSMNIRERLGLVQSSLALLVNNLRPDDTIAIVIYGTDAEPLLEPTPVADSDTIIEAIDRLTPGGSTNMEAGLLLGYEQARESYDEDAVNVVVLASDGVANVGSADAETLTDEITRAGEDGINLVTVGYGMGNYNDDLMEQLANMGNGFYSYIDTFEEAERLFVDELTPTLTVVAYDSKAQVVFDPEQVARYRLIGYENRLLDAEDFTDDSVDAGELGAGHQVSALYEVQPVGEIAPGAVLGQVSLRWADAPGGDVHQLDADVVWPNGESSDALRLASVVADAGELLKGTDIAADRELSLEALHAEAAELAERDVTGAQEVAAFIGEAIEAQPTRSTEEVWD